MTLSKNQDDSVETQLLDVKDQNARIEARLIEMAELLKEKPNNTTVNTVVNTTVTNQHTNNISVVGIRPWDGEQRIYLAASQMAAAFTENAKLREYTKLGDYAMVDKDIGFPYVMEIFMDLVKRAHTEPESRNIYLNPKRADQVLVFNKEGKWEVLSLQEATQLIFDGVTENFRRVRISWQEAQLLSTYAQNALAYAGLLYEDEPAEYVKKAKTPMSAHLTNCRDLQDKAIIANAVPLLETRAGLPKTITPTVSRFPKPPALIEPEARRSISPENAARAFLKARQTLPEEVIDEEYIKLLATRAETDTDYLIKKLWEAVEDKLLLGEDAALANAIIAKYDEDPNLYD